MKSKYIVELDGKYMNCFYNFSEACELREKLAKKFGADRVEIVADYEVVK